MAIGIGIGLSPSFGGGGGGALPPLAAYDSGTIVAATSIQTAAVANGLYSCLLQGGTGGTVWQYVAVTFGRANVSNWSNAALTFTRCRLFNAMTGSPHQIAAASGGFGAALRYGGLYGSAGVFECGSAYTARAVPMTGMINPTQSPDIAPVHQGWCDGGASHIFSFDDDAEGGVKKRNRDGTWSVVAGWENTSVAINHAGPGKRYTDGILSGVTTYNDVVLFPSETYNPLGSSDFKLTALENASGLPIIKSLVPNLTTGAGGDEMSGLAIRRPGVNGDVAGTIFVSDYHRNRIHCFSIADYNSTADGGTINRTRYIDYDSAMYETCDGIAYDPDLDAVIPIVRLKSTAGSGVVCLYLDPDTGAEMAAIRCNTALTPNAGHGGADIDSVSGKLGVFFDTGGVAKVTFTDKPASVTITSNVLGLALRNDWGVMFPGVGLAGEVSAGMICTPQDALGTATLGRTRMSDGNAVTRMALLLGTSSSSVFYSQATSASLFESRIQASVGAIPTAAGPTTAGAAGSRWAVGFWYDNAATPQHKSYAFYGNTDTALGASNEGTASPTTQTWSGGRFGVGCHATVGRPYLDAGMVWVLTTAMSRADFESIRNQPHQLFDATDPLSAGEKALAEAA